MAVYLRPSFVPLHSSVDPAPAALYSYPDDEQEIPPVTILVIADDEDVARTVPDCRCDVLISCGDLYDQTILTVAEKVGCSQILAVKGNHDAATPFDPRITDLHLKTVEIAGVTFGGFGGSWRYKPKGPFLLQQDEVCTALSGFPRVDVFVAHNSPRGIHDRNDGVHVGFVAFSTYIRDHQPKLFLHGHQHRNQMSLSGGTRVIGVYGCQTLVLDEGGRL